MSFAGKTLGADVGSWLGAVTTTPGAIQASLSGSGAVTAAISADGQTPSVNPTGGFPYWPDAKLRYRDDDDEDEQRVEEKAEQAVEVAARKVVAKILAPRPVPSMEDLERRELDAALDRVNVARTAVLEAAMRLEVSRVLAHHKRLMQEDDELLLM